MARRRLTDLYLVGEEVSFDDGTNDPVKVYIRKLNPTEQQIALRRANAARARIQALRGDPTSDEFVELWSSVEDADRDELLDVLVKDAKAACTEAVMDRVGSEDEWATDSYLDGLRDAWADGLEKKWVADPDDPEVRRVRDELDRYDAQVAAEVDARAADIAEEFNSRTDEALRDLVFDKSLAMRASIEWLNEYRRCEIWQATKETDKKTRYFKDRDEIDLLAPTILGDLVMAYQRITVEPLEGKGSGASPSSSPSSEPVEPVETDSSSGREESAA